MSAENPFKGAASNDKNRDENNQDSLEHPAIEAAFADWCDVNGVPQEKIQGDISLTEKTALYDSVFRAGAENFRNGFVAQTEGRALDLVTLKSELDALRAGGDISVVGAKEQEIAVLFQEAISAYKYDEVASHPRDILAKKEMNCVGATFIGGMLLEEVGIRSVQASGGSHCFTIVVTSDNRVLWQDMQDGKETPELFNQDLTNEKLKGASPEDIVKFAQNPEGSMTFVVDAGRWKDKPVTIKAFFPGIEVQELINTGFMLTNTGKHEEALEILEVAAEKAPDDSSIYLGLGKALHRLGRYEEALVKCKKALEIDPTYIYAQEEIDEISSARLA
jgi:hypothetical protein